MASEQDSNNSGSDDGDSPKYMTAEEVTKMVTGANERMKKSLTAEIEKAVGGVSETVGETIKKHLEGLKTEPPKPDDQPGKPSPEVQALTQKLSEMENSIKERDKALQEAKTQGQRDTARNSLRDALAPHVRPDAVDMVTQLLFDAQGVVQVQDDGNPVFKIRQSPMAGLPEEDMELPIKDGVANWLKTDNAKLFLPAPNTGSPEGTPRGAQRSRGVKLGNDGMPSYEGPATSDEERVRRADERARALAEKYPQVNDSF